MDIKIIMEKEYLSNSSLRNYWIASGEEKEVRDNFNFNINGAKDDFLKLIQEEKIKIKLTGYGAENTQNENQEQIDKNIEIERNQMYSKMVVYGLLTYNNEEISIPNNELRGKFMDLINEKDDLIEYRYLKNNSEKLFKATLERNVNEVCKILKKFHMDNTTLKNYYNHVTLTSVVYFGYYHARNKYCVESEEPAGDGVADFIFYPKNGNEDIAIIIELKVVFLVLAVLSNAQTTKDVNAAYEQLSKQTSLPPKIPPNPPVTDKKVTTTIKTVFTTTTRKIPVTTSVPALPEGTKYCENEKSCDTIYLTDKYGEWSVENLNYCYCRPFVATAVTKAIPVYTTEQKTSSTTTTTKALPITTTTTKAIPITTTTTKALPITTTTTKAIPITTTTTKALPITTTTTKALPITTTTTKALPITTTTTKAIPITTTTTKAIPITTTTTKAIPITTTTTKMLPPGPTTVHKNTTII
ncbi:hypothetical protein PIROE2DRAFT_63263 [Piromyces sp. E2]|nr:hypothetical protein PIROE2DRAFT_63263 [Piromyces sp. E2]|eukprot:OUM60272.1 hypothetical protein PIROE2DRAFT_63263 [Piromyces sp. E2]